MAAGDEGLWRTLALIYATVFASAVCIPPVTVLPVILGFDSLVVVFVFGCLGLGLTGVVVALLTAQMDALLARIAEETARLSEETPPVGDTTQTRSS